MATSKKTTIGGIKSSGTTSGLDSSVSNLKKTVANSVGGTNNVVGINIAKIGNITCAIDTYIRAIEKNVNIVVSTSDIQKGIKGTNSVNTLRQLGTEVNNRVKSYLKELTDLKTKLTELKSQYSKLDSENTIFSNKAKSISK